MSAEPRATRVNHTGVSVLDMDRSLAFYVDLLGLELVLDLDVASQPGLETVVGMAGIVGRVVFLDASDSRVELWHYRSPSGSPLPDGHIPADHGVSHVGFTVNDVDAMYERLVAANVTVLSPPQDLGLHKTMYVRGPDGEFVELLEDRGDPAMLARATERTRQARSRDTSAAG
ncbi:MAG: hypothetical protein QOC92_1085 [Acidimicrobiaceae bacterium]|jgi:catechol 2,3-dioxygenase-like lactoylglutathione lyase family enzyme